jgi:predicted secreted protein
MPGWSSEAPSDLHLQAGEDFRFPLGGAGSAGYLWTWTIGGDAQAVSVAVEAASAPPVPTPGVLHGGSVGRIVVLRALQPGEASLHFVLARPTKHSNPLASFTVKVTVSAAGEQV